MDDVHLLCELSHLTSAAKSCKYKKGQVLNFTMTMIGQTTAVVIDTKNNNPIKFDTFVANFSGQHAHYSPVLDTIMVLDHKQLHIVRMFRNKNKQYRAAGHFKLIDQKKL